MVQIPSHNIDLSSSLQGTTVLLIRQWKISSHIYKCPTVSASSSDAGLTVDPVFQQCHRNLSIVYQAMGGSSVTWRRQMVAGSNLSTEGI
jgi:hypothetical protein